MATGMGGERELRRLRKRRDYLLRHVAEGTGYGVSHIARVERGAAHAGRKLVEALARFYAMPVPRMRGICTRTAADQ